MEEGNNKEQRQWGQRGTGGRKSKEGRKLRLEREGCRELEKKKRYCGLVTGRIPGSCHILQDTSSDPQPELSHSRAINTLGSEAATTWSWLSRTQGLSEHSNTSRWPLLLLTAVRKSRII